jgi:hypothetical protein
MISSAKHPASLWIVVMRRRIDRPDGYAADNEIHSLAEVTGLGGEKTGYLRDSVVIGEAVYHSASLDRAVKRS